MPVAVELKGRIERLVLDQGYLDTINALNTSAAAGKKFILADGQNGKNVAVSIDQIITIEELETESFAGIA